MFCVIGKGRNGDLLFSFPGVNESSSSAKEQMVFCLKYFLFLKIFFNLKYFLLKIQHRSEGKIVLEEVFYMKQKQLHEAREKLYN